MKKIAIALVIATGLLSAASAPAIVADKGPHARTCQFCFV